MLYTQNAENNHKYRVNDLLLGINQGMMMYKSWIFSFCFFIIFIGVMFFSCSSDHPELVPETPETEKDTVIFSDRIAVAPLDNKTIDEASGMAMSILHENHFWTHNDSGDDPRIFLINNAAQYQVNCTLKGAVNRDWEDIAVAKDQVSGKSRIFIGDIGDNNAVHDFGFIYIMDEPSALSNENITVTNYDIITFRYQDGKRDAETLMVDPQTGDIYIVSKRESSVNLYQIKYPFSFKDTITANKLLSIPYTQIVGGDSSADGPGILMKNYSKAWYWPRKKGKSIADAVSLRPYETPYIQEPQGEAICWSRDGKSFFTISEESPFKTTPILYRYDRK